MATFESRRRTSSSSSGYGLNLAFASPVLSPYASPLTSPLHSPASSVPASPVLSPRREETIDDEIQIERNAGLIMATNNSSIVSKRSVEILYLPEPHFYRYFVKKSVRRSPTINRGYWLRMQAIDWVVQQFLDKHSDKDKVVINLGCGYDPLPFQWLARESELCARTKFIDVDYPALMETKAKIVNSTSRIHNLFHKSKLDSSALDDAVLIDTDEYSAIGCDLRNLPRLTRLLRSITKLESCEVLFVAEVSITYMATADANAVIQWGSTISKDVTFCLLEQCSPDQVDNGFTQTMLKHFAKLGVPLRAVLEYPGEHAQIQRFRDAGYSNVDYQNLWELWTDPRFLSPSQRMKLDDVEPFDEWEEFALFASHYCLIIAHNQGTSLLSERPRARRDSADSATSNFSARTQSPIRPVNEWFAYRYVEDAGTSSLRHHASICATSQEDAILVHGGIGPKSRLSSMALVSQQHVIDSGLAIAFPPPEVGTRCCHTLSPLNDDEVLLVGGRLSPTHVLKDCWLQTGKVWIRVHDLPQPRFRHRVSAITLPNNKTGAICFGGKTDARTVATEVLLWDPDSGWSELRQLGDEPVPRFGANFIRLGYNHGLLCGGMRVDGCVCQGLWRWTFVIREHKVIGIAFRPCKALDTSVGTYPWFARFGASYMIARDELLIIGGIAKSGCIPQPYEIISLLGSFSNFKHEEAEVKFRTHSIMPVKSRDCPRPFLIGHSTHHTKNGLCIILGGGAVCFSFGSYFNKGAWILYEKDAGLTQEWRISSVDHAQDLPPENTHALNLQTLQSKKEQSRSVQTTASTVPSVNTMNVGSRSGVDHDRVFKGSVIADQVAGTNEPSSLKNPQSFEDSRTPIAQTRAIEDQETLHENFSNESNLFKQSMKSARASTQISTPVRSLTFTTKQEFIAHVNTSIPAHILNLNCGLCLQKWTIPYLRSAIPADRSVITHEATSNTMNFTRKDFAYTTLTFQAFLDKLNEPLTHLYLRSLASTDSAKTPANFAADWPQLAADFSLPDPLTPILSEAHSSVLRISNDISMWLHYDVMANILFQIRGVKKLMLFPPEDIPKLGFAAGSTTSMLDLIAPSPTDMATSNSSEPMMAPPPNTTPQIVILKPGDSLFIPPLWAHTGLSLRSEQNESTNIKSPSEQRENPYLNISINIFFRNFSPNLYAAGRDVYGNRDLAAYEKGRRDIDTIVKSFGSRPNGKRGKKAAIGSDKAKGKGTEMDVQLGRDEQTSKDEGLTNSEVGQAAEEEEEGQGSVVLDEVPLEVRKAYLLRLAGELMDRAQNLT